MGSSGVIRFLLAAALLASLSSGCRAGGSLVENPASSDTGGAYAGQLPGVDEVVGIDGPTVSGFVDAEYQQVRRPDAIAPIYEPRFVPAAESGLGPDELVIGLVINDDARAYPSGILYTREMVNDNVGGVPVLVTWCPLCYTALVHLRNVGDATATFGNHGALYKGGMTWYDHDTGSVWSQPTGQAIAGPLAGASLELVPSQLTTWEMWRSAHPDSRALAADTPSQPYRGRQPGEQHVVGVVVDGVAAAWPYEQVVRQGRIGAAVGDTPVEVWHDADTGAVRAATDGRRRDELPVVIAYRWAWLKFYAADTVRSLDGGG